MRDNCRIQLLPGVWLRAAQTEKFKSSYLSVSFLTPLRAETAAEHALIPAVLRRGSQGHPDLQSIAAALDELYGGGIEPFVRKKGETQCVGLAASFLDDALTPDGSPVLEPAAHLLGELLLRPATQEGMFRADYVQGEKENLISRIRAQVNDKRRYALQRLTQIMCAGEDFGVPQLGEEAAAAAITPESLWARYQSLLARSRVEIFFCGSAEPDRVAAALREALADLPREGDFPLPGCAVKAGAEQPRTQEEVLDVTQGKLALGFRTGGMEMCGEDFPALMMLNAVYGGTTLSKLFLNVRERLSLCYYASSTLEKRKGLLLVSSGIEFAQYQTARDEILAQLEAVRRGEVTPQELEGARRILVGACRATLDAQDRLEDFWLGQAAAGLETDVQALVEGLEAVKLEQVIRAARALELDTVYFLKGQEG